MPTANPNSATKRFITENELADGKAVSTERFVSVATVTGTKKKNFAHGYGSRSREDANAGYSHFDIAVTPDGGTTINRPSGKLRLVVYSTTDGERYKVILGEYDLSDMRDASTDPRTEKPVIPQASVGAAESEMLGWEVRVDSNDGEAIHSSSCDAHVPYGLFRVNQS